MPRLAFLCASGILFLPLPVCWERAGVRAPRLLFFLPTSIFSFSLFAGCPDSPLWAQSGLHRPGALLTPGIFIGLEQNRKSPAKLRHKPTPCFDHPGQGMSSPPIPPILIPPHPRLTHLARLMRRFNLIEPPSNPRITRVLTFLRVVFRPRLGHIHHHRINRQR